jgi:hypothetical protein
VQHHWVMHRGRVSLVWFALLTSAPASLHAIDNSGLELEWHSPAGCPDRADLASRVPEAPPALAARGSRPHARGVIVEDARGYRLDLWTNEGHRTLFANDCEELASATALVLSLLIDSQRHAVAPAASARFDEAQPKLWPWIRADVVADLGTLPHLGLGPGLGVGLRIERLNLELSGSWLPKQDVRSLQRTAAVGELQLWSGELGTCYAITTGVGLSPCLHLEYGRIANRGTNIATCGRTPRCRGAFTR